MKNNKHITPKERGLIKGALRRVFSRSELRKQAIDASRIEHADPERPRVTKWSRCPSCKEPVATYQMEVDHIAPVVPVDSALEHMTADELVNRIWCEPNNLLAICKPCHYTKGKQEASLRRQNKKGKLNGKSVKRKSSSQKP